MIQHAFVAAVWCKASSNSRSPQPRHDGAPCSQPLISSHQSAIIIRSLSALLLRLLRARDFCLTSVTFFSETNLQIAEK